MRFIFENGGRSGMRAADALADGLSMWIKNPDFGDLYVDFSRSYDGRGQLFRTEQQMTDDLGNALRETKISHGVQGSTSYAAEAEAVSLVGASYWAEAEAMALARSLAPLAPMAGPVTRL